MIRINLLPARELEAEVARRQELTVVGLCLGLTAVVLLGVYLVQSYRLSNVESEFAELRKEIEVLNTKAEGVVGLREKKRLIREKINVIEALSKKKTGPVRVMESLSSATPTRLWLTEFKESAGNVSLKGLAVDNQTIADFLKALSSSPYFEDVELVETTQVKEKGVTVKKFIMKSKLFYRLPAPAPATASVGKRS